jgi:hypothetical protein
VAVGTLVPEHSRVRAAARDLGLMEQAARAREEGGKVGEAAAEVERQLKL